MKKIVLSKFRLGDKSERVAALADEWGCSVTVAVGRLLAAGLAAVDRDERMTPDAIRAGFAELDKMSIDDWVAQKSTPDAVRRNYVVSPGGHIFNAKGVCAACGHKTTDDPDRCPLDIHPGEIVDVVPAGAANLNMRVYTRESLTQAVHSYDGPTSLSVASEISMEAIEAVEGLFPPASAALWPSLPDTAGKRMFDEAAWHAFEAEYSGKFKTVELTPEELQTAILNGYPVRSVPSELWGGLPTEADQNYASAKADLDAYRRRLGFPSPACGSWGNSGFGLPTVEDIEAAIATTPEAVAAEEERQRLEGPTELPDSLRDGSKVLERIKYLDEIGAPLQHSFGLQITDATRDALSGKGSFVDELIAAGSWREHKPNWFIYHDAAKVPIVALAFETAEKNAGRYEYDKANYEIGRWGSWVKTESGSVRLSWPEGTDIDRMKREIELVDIRLNGNANALVEVATVVNSLTDPDESCPGCGCQPGDGPTEGCTHPDGCGYYEDQDPRSMGWVGDNGLP